MEYNLETIAKIWPTIEPIFSVPRTKADYHRLVVFLDDLIDLICLKLEAKESCQRCCRANAS